MTEEQLRALEDAARLTATEDDMTDELRTEERAEAIIALLASGPHTVQQVADTLFLTTAEARVALMGLASQRRVVQMQEIGQEHPRWLRTQAS